MRLQDVDSFSLTNNIAPEPTGSGGDVICQIASGLHDTALAQTLLPLPCRTHGVVNGSRGCPSEYFVGICRVGPYLFDVAGAAWCDTVGNLYACGALKGGYEFHYAESVACAEVEDFNLGFRLVFQHTLYGDYVGFGKIDHIDEVADAVAVACIVVVAEYAEFLRMPMAVRVR